MYVYLYIHEIYCLLGPLVTSITPDGDIFNCV